MTPQLDLEIGREGGERGVIDITTTTTTIAVGAGGLRRGVLESCSLVDNNAFRLVLVVGVSAVMGGEKRWVGYSIASLGFRLAMNYDYRVGFVNLFLFSLIKYDINISICIPSLLSCGYHGSVKLEMVNQRALPPLPPLPHHLPHIIPYPLTTHLLTGTRISPPSLYAQ